ncbi:MAG: hypothetical protein IIV18_07250, partial [Lachnospiraceae bacterium]|nr:hypothetical protein [Lachnospiraceae bacterium]
MERNVQIRFRMISLILAAALGLCGCQKQVSFENQYSFEDRLVQLEEVGSDGFSRSFASDISAPGTIENTDTVLTADAAAVYEIGGTEAVFEQSALKRMNPASTTKIMTAILALKYGNLDDLVTVTD